MNSATFVGELRDRLVSTLCPSDIIARGPRTILVTLTISLDRDDDHSMAHPGAAIDTRLTRHTSLSGTTRKTSYSSESWATFHFKGIIICQFFLHLVDLCHACSGDELYLPGTTLRFQFQVQGPSTFKTLAAMVVKRFGPFTSAVVS